MLELIYDCERLASDEFFKYMTEDWPPKPPDYQNIIRLNPDNLSLISGTQHVIRAKRLRLLSPSHLMDVQVGGFHLALHADKFRFVSLFNAKFVEIMDYCPKVDSVRQVS